MKKNKIVAINIAIGLLLSQQVWGGIGSTPAKNGNSTSSSGSSSSNGTVRKDEKTAPGMKTGVTASKSCDGDKNNSKYFPLDFFSKLSRDGSSLAFEMRPDNKILVKVPFIIKRCGKFVPEIYQNPDTKDVTIKMSVEPQKTYSEYLECLRTTKVNDLAVTQILSKVLKDKDGNAILNSNGKAVTAETAKDETIDHNNIPDKEYSEYSYVIDYNFDKKTDITKTVKLSYGYPKEFDGRDGYGPAYGLDENVALPDCMKAEKIAPEITYINKGQDVLIDELKAICRSGTAQEIAAARKSIGNAEALKDIAEKLQAELDAGYLVKVKEDVAKISAAMTKIEDRLTREKDSIDEPSAKKLARQYAELTQDLDRKFLNPAIYRLDTLMKQVADMDSEDPKRKGIDDEIKKINQDVGAFAGRKTSLNGLYEVMSKYAINDSAKTVEDIRLKSLFYGTVYAGPADERGKPITFEEANQKQYSGLQKFDKVLTDWTDQYLVRKGNLAPIQKTERERTATYEKMNKRWYDYQKDEQEKMQKYCAAGWTGSPKNPVQCQAFMAGAKGRQDAELGRRKKDLQFIQGRNDKLTRMGTSYNDYQRRQVANDTRAEDSEPYAAPYSTYEDKFRDRFPGYYGAQAYTPYDASMYSMGGQTAAMNMGNTGNYNPTMINPQMQVQQGQYQMQNGGQMAGAWPSI